MHHWDSDINHIFQRAVASLSEFVKKPAFVCMVNVTNAQNYENDPVPPPGTLTEPFGRRGLQDDGLDESYVGLWVDFAVSAPFTANDEPCDSSNTAFVTFVAQFFAEFDSRTGDPLQAAITSEGAGTWLESIISTDEDIVMKLDDPHVTLQSSAENHFCSNPDDHTLSNPPSAAPSSAPTVNSTDLGEVSILKCLSPEVIKNLELAKDCKAVLGGGLAGLFGAIISLVCLWRKCCGKLKKKRKSGASSNWGGVEMNGKFSISGPAGVAARGDSEASSGSFFVDENPLVRDSMSKKVVKGVTGLGTKFKFNNRFNVAAAANTKFAAAEEEEEAGRGGSGGSGGSGVKSVKFAQPPLVSGAKKEGWGLDENVWEEHHDEEGNKFFYNSQTKESTWDSPYKKFSTALSFHSQNSTATLGGGDEDENEDDDPDRPKSRRYSTEEYGGGGGGFGSKFKSAMSFGKS